MATNMRIVTFMETTETRTKVYDILKGFSTAMFVSIGPGGRPEARPMQIAKVEDEGGDIYFFTGRGGTLATEIKEEAIVLLAFQNDNSSYLSIRGKARVIEDAGRHQFYWKEAYRVWFPGGPSDPTLALIGVAPIDAEYWDTRGTNKLEYLVEAAKAYVKGEKPDAGDPDQHGKTSL
jgi:general stress protein 26